MNTAVIFRQAATTIRSILGVDSIFTDAETGTSVASKVLISREFQDQPQGFESQTTGYRTLFKFDLDVLGRRPVMGDSVVLVEDNVEYVIGEETDSNKYFSKHVVVKKVEEE